MTGMPVVSPTTTVTGSPKTVAAGGCIVALAASVGGLSALSQILAGLPADFPAPIVIVQHIAPGHPSLMSQILNRCTDLQVRQAKQGDLLRPGTIFIAPPDRHLIVNANGSLSLDRTERIHYSRPSADVLFGSVAEAFGSRAIVTVLTGMGSDGAAGVQAVKRKHGTTIAQNEETSEAFGMPGAAIHTGDIDYVLPLAEIAPTLIRLATAGAA